MHSTAQSLVLPALSAEQHASLATDASLLSLYQAFGAVPDPRSRHGQHYDLLYVLTCLVAALLCNCNSLEAVGQWCRDQQFLLRRLFGHCGFTTALRFSSSASFRSPSAKEIRPAIIHRPCPLG